MKSNKINPNNRSSIDGLAMKDKRLSLNLTQEQLAAVFGVSVNTIARWERGESIPAGSGLVWLAFEALEAKQMITSEYKNQKEKIMNRMKKQEKSVRQRVRHPQQKLDA